MSSIIPVPTTRVGDYFVRQRLIGQVQGDQLDLFKLQTEISTGQRLQLPSDDAPAALRGIGLQRLLARKAQVATNVKSNNSFLTAANSSLTSVAKLLNDIKGGTIGVAGTLSNDAQRQELVNEVNLALQDLVKTGNTQSQGQYLFSGSRSQVAPYTYDGQYVQYNSNEGTLRTYVDLDRLFETNLAGTDVFGGISSQAKGLPLTPAVNADTLLSTVNGGDGINKNPAITITVTNGSSTSTSVVDLSKAVTLGDVARLIEQGAPTGSHVTASVTGKGLTISTSTGTIRVGEVGEGKTATELGILTPVGAAPTASIAGDNLHAAVLKTTPLDLLLGTKAQGVIQSTGNNNDIALTASKNGVDFNGVDVVFANDGVAGAETATYNSTSKTLTVHVEPGSSTAKQVAAAISAEGTFQATVDYHDQTSSGQAGASPVEAKDFGLVTADGDGAALDTAAGLVISNGGKTATLDTSAVSTVEGLLNLINGAGLGVVAEINANQDGINVRSNLSGSDLTIGENGGQLATQLGIRTYTTDSKLAGFNRGVGVQTNASLETLDSTKLDSVRIIARDGTALTVSLTGDSSLQDVIDSINNVTGNNTGTTAVLARLSSNGNRIELVDSSTVTTGSLTVQAPTGTQAAEYLGLVAPGDTERTSTTIEGTSDYVLSGGNVLGNDFSITARDGTKLWVDIGDAKTVQDVIELINNNPANTGSPPPITARLAKFGNGIELVDSSTGTGALTVKEAEGSQAAELLGFVPTGQTQASSTTADSDGHYVLQSKDNNTVESDSVFNTLIRLKQALQSNDTAEIGRSIDRLDTDLSRVTFARSEIGSRLQSLDVIGTHLQDENVQLKASLSDDLDVDLVQAISDMTARQYSLQASLQTAAQLLQLSLLNFI